MGRPKGSKNRSVGKKQECQKNKSAKIVKSGVFKRSDSFKAEVVIPSDIRTCKFFGFCKCDFMITRFEMVTKSIYQCPRCGKRAKVNTLKAVMKSSGEKPTSKKEYLNTGAQPFNRDHYHYSSGVQLEPKDLKIAK